MINLNRPANVGFGLRFDKNVSKHLVDALIKAAENPAISTKINRINSKGKDLSIIKRECISVRTGKPLEGISAIIVDVKTKLREFPVGKPWQENVDADVFLKSAVDMFSKVV